MIETYQKKRNFALFDKFWYLKRAEGFTKIENQGFCTDKNDNVSEFI